MSQELFDEADRLEQSGRTEAALGVWRQLAEASPSRNVFLRIAHLTRNLGLLDDAECAFKRALEIDEHSALALKGLGSLAIDRRDDEAAGEYLKGACKIEEDPGGFTMLGAALARAGKGIEAEEAYRRAIQIDPNYEEAYYNLGVLLRNDRPSEAQALFEKALELDPSYGHAHRELGFMLSKRGAALEAQNHIRRAIQLKPADTTSVSTRSGQSTYWS